MNLVDVLLAIVMLLSVYSGFKKGFIAGAVDLLLLGISLVLAFSLSRYVAAFFEKYILAGGVWTLPLTFLLTFLVIRLILTVLASRLLKSLTTESHENILNKSLGIIPGVVNGLIYAAILSALLLGLPMFDGLSAKTRESRIANNLTPHVEWAEDKLAPIFDKAVNQSINKLTVDNESNKFIKLPYTVMDPETREDLEAKMLVLVNEERTKEGLPILKADPEMREVARAHSKDMFARGYFSHINPEKISPAERARNAGVKFITAGENLALAQTLNLAHTGLMNSPGHRANILRKTFGRVGIGILDGGRHGLMVTQNFRN